MSKSKIPRSITKTTGDKKVAAVVNKTDIKAKQWRDVIKKDRERNRFAHALQLREILKKKSRWFSTERNLVRKKQIIEEILKSVYITKEEKLRLARALGMIYKLDLNVPASTRLMSWMQEMQAKRSTINKPRQAKVNQDARGRDKQRLRPN